MALHGLAEVVIGVSDVDAVASFCRDITLTETAPGILATADGGEQLRLPPIPIRPVVEVSVAADDADDLPARA